MTETQTPIPAIGDRVVADTRALGERHYRVTNFHRERSLVEPTPPADDDFEAELAYELELESYQARLADGKVHLEVCAREDAQFVSLTGIGGGILRIEDVRIVGRMDWDAEQQAYHEGRAARRIGQPSVAIDRYWEK